MAETAKARERRIREGFFERYVKAPVLDIGCGDDPIIPDCIQWDKKLGHGDATCMSGVPDESYGCVFCSHILEHLSEPITAIRNWYRLVRPGGFLVIVVPSRDLYEKRKELPSLWNLEHKAFYDLISPEPPCTRGLLDDVLVAIGEDAHVVSLTVQDAGWVDTGPENHSVGEYSLECVIHKPKPECSNLSVFTIVLNGMPWLPSIFTVLNSLNLDWHWYVAEGAALNVKCSHHCQPIDPQLSSDGTGEFLDSLKQHPRVTVIRKPIWDGKIEMVNAAMSQIKNHCVLMQMDSDEVWTAEHIEKVYSLLASQPPGSAAQFACRYFVGPHLVTVGMDVYGNYSKEWIRAWRFAPGQLFETHCPPVLQNQKIVFDREQTLTMGLNFQHYSWVTESQTAFKSKFYGHESNEGWKQLQAHTEFPTSLKPFMPWASDNTIVDRI